LANEFIHVKFLKVDIDKMGEQLEDVLREINTVPTFYFYIDGILTDMLSGANPSLLKKKIEKLNATKANEARPMIKFKDSLSDETIDVQEANREILKQQQNCFSDSD
jgi:hypothetical protein